MMIVPDADTRVAVLNSFLDLAVHFISIYIKNALKSACDYRIYTIK